MEFILIAIIIIFVLEYTKRIDTNKFIGEAEPYFRFLMEDDYKFLLSIFSPSIPLTYHLKYAVPLLLSDPVMPTPSWLNHLCPLLPHSFSVFHLIENKSLYSLSSGMNQYMLITWSLI